MANDRASVASLTVTNSTIIADFTATHSQILISLQDLVKLHVTIGDLKQKKSVAGNKSSGSYPNHYCWTCDTRYDHPNRNFPTLATGHQKDSTRNDNKGGTHKNCNRAP